MRHRRFENVITKGLNKLSLKFYCYFLLTFLFFYYTLEADEE